MLTFKEFTEANTNRCNRWHPGFPNDNAWTGADWSNATCGEAGEMANVVKKLRRIETGTAPGPDDPPEEELKNMLADEIADVFCYLDLLATFYGINLPEAIVRKWNRVSERQGFPDRISDRTDHIFGIVNLTQDEKPLQAKVTWQQGIYEQIDLGTHTFGFGGVGDGYCYGHQTFDCLDNLTSEEREALNSV